jgi:hypothetical protein
MSVQTTYSIEHGKAYAGTPADLQTKNTVSRVNATLATIPWGKGVVSDGEYGMQLGASGATADEFVGVIQFELNRATADGEVSGVPVERDGTVLTDGVIWVRVLDTVAVDAPVYLRVGATDQGDFSGIAGAGLTEGLLLPNAKFLSAGDAGDLVRIKLTIGG